MMRTLSIEYFTNGKFGITWTLAVVTVEPSSH